MDSIPFWLSVDDRRKGLSPPSMEEAAGSVAGTKRAPYLLSEFGVHHLSGLWRPRKRLTWAFGAKHKTSETHGECGQISQPEGHLCKNATRKVSSNALPRQRMKEVRTWRATVNYTPGPSNSTSRKASSGNDQNFWQRFTLKVHKKHH